jgi:hypothetical protein
MLLTLAVTTPLLWLSAPYLHTQIVVAERGVHVEAIVVDRNTKRGPDELVLRLLDDQNIETTISHWPAGTEVGDILDVAYDVQNPGRVVATDAPWVDVPIVIVGLLHLGALTLLVLILPASVVTLVERGRTPGRARAERSPVWLRCLHAARATWLWIGESARNQGVLKGLMVFVLVPLATLGLGIMTLVPEVADLKALQTRGVSGTAVVRGSEWDDGAGTALHVRIREEGTPAVIDHWEGAPRRGETIDVVYDPQDPRVVQQRGVHPWGRDQWLFVAVFTAGVLGTFFVAPAALIGMVRGRGRGEVSRSGAAA